MDQWQAINPLKMLQKQTGKADQFNVDSQKLETLEFPEVIGAQPLAQIVWLQLAAELDVSYYTANTTQKIGAGLEEAHIKQLAQGNKDLVETLFKQIEEYSIKICGQDMLDSLKSYKGTIFQVPKYPQLQVQADAYLQSQKIQVKPNVDIGLMDAFTPPNKTTNSLEFVLTTLARALNIKPVTVAGLLANNNQFLRTACKKGVKGQGFEPLISWYREIIDHGQSLALLLIAELQEYNDFRHLADTLSTIACGLFSSRVELISICLDSLIVLFKNFDERGHKIQPYAWTWFVSEEKEILSQVIYILTENPELGHKLPEIITSLQYSRNRYKEVYSYSLQKICSSRQDFMTLILDLIPHIKHSQSQLAEESGLILYLLDIGSREAENDGTHSDNERAIALTFLTELWLSFTDVIDSKSQLNGVLFMLLQKAIQEKSRTLRLQAAVNLFRLFEYFSLNKNISAPIIYRALVYGLIENPSDEIIREIFWKNFQQIFQSQQAVPIALLVEPLLRQINDVAVRRATGLKIREFDLVFLEFIAKHPKLQSEHVLGLMQFFSSLIFEDIGFSKICIDLYLQLIIRFKDDLEIERATLNFSAQCQHRLFEIERTEVPPGDWNNSKSKRVKERPPHLPSVTLQQNGIHKQLIYLFLSRILYQSNERVYNQLNDQILTTKRSLYQVLKIKSKVIEAILHLNLGRTGDGSPHSQQSFNDTALVPYGHGMTTASVFKFKATMVIQRIQQTMTQKEDQQRQLMEQSKISYEKRKVNLKRQIDRRRVQLGVPTLGADAEKSAAVIQEVDENQPQTSDKQLIKWYDLQMDFEDEDRISLDLFQKRAQKLWQNMFSKYANAGIYRVNDTKLGAQRQFEETKRKNEQISLPELIKLLKDHNVTPKLFKKNEIQDLVRLINLQFGSNSLTQFDYQGFLTFLEQAAVNIFSRSQNYYLNHLSPSGMLKHLVNTFYEATVNRGLSSVFFDGLVEKEDEDDEDEIVQELTERLEENEDYPLPAGYAIVTEKLESQQYYLPAQILPFVNKSTTMAVYILDELLDKLFNFHFLEPYVIYEDTQKIKKVFVKPKVELRSLDAAHVVNPARPFGTDGKLRSAKLSPLQKVFLPPKMKLLIYDRAPEDQKHCEEVAQTLELILQAVERGSEDIYDAKPRQIVNKALLDQQEREETHRKIEQLREQKRLERSEQLKQQIQDQKNAIIEEKRLKELEKRRLEKKQLKEKPNLSPKQASLKIQKPGPNPQANLPKRLGSKSPDDKFTLPEITPQKKLKFNFESQLYAPRVSTSVPPQRKKEIATTQHQAAPEELKKLKQNVVNQVQKLQEQKQALVMKEKESLMKEQALKDAIRKKAEKVLVANRDQRNFENEFQQQLTDFMETDPVNAVFQAYARCIEGYFQFYCKQAKAQLGFDINFRLQNMNFKEFVKFGHQTKVVPVLISSEDLVQVFRNVARQQQTNESSAVVNSGTTVAEKNIIQFISIEAFKQALVRVCVYGHQVLGGLSQQQVEHKTEVDHEQWQSDQKLKEYVKRKEKERKIATKQVLLEMKAEFEEKQKKAQEILHKKAAQNKEVGSQMSVLEQKTRDEQDFLRYQKQQENIGDGLQRRVDQRLGVVSDVAQILQSKPFAGTTTANLKHQYEKLVNEGQINDKLSKIDIRDNVYKTKLPMDIKLVSSETVMTLFKYVGMEPGEINQFDIDKKLNAQRIEITGTKPTLKVMRSKLAELGVEAHTEFEQEKDQNERPSRKNQSKLKLRDEVQASKQNMTVIAESEEKFVKAKQPELPLKQDPKQVTNEAKPLPMNDKDGDELIKNNPNPFVSKLKLKTDEEPENEIPKPKGSQSQAIDQRGSKTEAKTPAKDLSPRKSDLMPTQSKDDNQRKSGLKTPAKDTSPRKSVSIQDSPQAKSKEPTKLQNLAKSRASLEN